MEFLHIFIATLRRRSPSGGCEKDVPSRCCSHLCIYPLPLDDWSSVSWLPWCFITTYLWRKQRRSCNALLYRYASKTTVWSKTTTSRVLKFLFCRLCNIKIIKSSKGSLFNNVAIKMAIANVNILTVHLAKIDVPMLIADAEKPLKSIIVHIVRVR